MHTVQVFIWIMMSPLPMVGSSSVEKRLWLMFPNYRFSNTQLH
jgi:hypothetical protein